MHTASPSDSLPLSATAAWQRAVALSQRATLALSTLAPAVDLLIRVLVASVFFKSGLTKLANWDSTVSLFENEYAVPLLSPELAALFGTGVELIFPVLLVLGLGGRLAAFVLFVFNIVAVISYPDIGDIGIKDHQTWGLLLLVTLLHGPGRLSLDRLIGQRLETRRH
jgi:putative oxidoreductase